MTVRVDKEMRERINAKKVDINKDREHIEHIKNQVITDKDRQHIQHIQNGGGYMSARVAKGFKEIVLDESYKDINKRGYIYESPDGGKTIYRRAASYDDVSGVKLDKNPNQLEFEFPDQHTADLKRTKKIENILKSYPKGKKAKLAGDSIWSDEGKLPKSVRVKSINTIYEEANDETFIQVHHDGPWNIYTDSGFAKFVSKELGRNVNFTEQGAQQNGVAHMHDDNNPW